VHRRILYPPLIQFSKLWSIIYFVIEYDIKVFFFRLQKKKEILLFCHQSLSVNVFIQPCFRSTALDSVSFPLPTIAVVSPSHVLFLLSFLISLCLSPHLLKAVKVLLDPNNSPASLVPYKMGRPLNFVGETNHTNGLSCYTRYNQRILEQPSASSCTRDSLTTKNWLIPDPSKR